MVTVLRLRTGNFPELGQAYPTATDLVLVLPRKVAAHLHQVSEDIQQRRTETRQT